MLSPPTFRMAAAALLVAGLMHSGLSLWLHALGESPSGPSPFSAQSHYRVQAALLPAIYFAQWWVLSVVVARIVGVARHQVQGTCGWVLGICTVGLLIVPDSILLWQGGGDALRWGVRFVLPALFVGTWLWLTLHLTKLKLGAPTQRVMLASLLGLVAQAAVGALVVR